MCGPSGGGRADLLSGLLVICHHVDVPIDGETGRKGLWAAGSPSSSRAMPRLPLSEQRLLLEAWPTARAGWAVREGPRGRTYSVSESSMSDTAGTTLSMGVHAGLTQERPRWMTSCTYLGNNRVSEPRRPGAGLPPLLGDNQVTDSGRSKDSSRGSISTTQGSHCVRQARYQTPPGWWSCQDQPRTGSCLRRSQVPDGSFGQSPRAPWHTLGEALM